MGYETRLHLVDVKIKDDRRHEFDRLFIRKRNRREIQYFLGEVMIDDAGFLCFKSSDDNAYVPDETDGSIPAKDGKWREPEAIMDLLKQYVQGGKMVFHSLEGDGDAFGWEFDGKGRARALELRPKGKWE
jgi:hypothetical protein